MAAEVSNNRTIIIGLDGVPYGAIKNLTQTGVMKNLAEIIENGVFRQMTSCIPEISSIAWSSVITGKNPGEHGIYGFIDLHPGTYRIFFPNFANLKASPFWYTDNNKQSVIMNVPSTYPARELNGILIAGFVALNLDKAVYPQELVPKLKEIGYQVDVDSGKASKSMDLFLRDLDKTLKARIEAYRYLWHSQKWDNFMLVFTGTDRLFHFLWNAYEDHSHKYHEEVIDHFKQIDEAIGEIRETMDERDNLILLSDHGFEALETEVNINFYLKEHGFLSLKDGKQENLSNIDHSTKAFALDPARIYVNLEGKYPEGSVNAKDKEGVIQDVISLFESLEINGRKAIKQIFRGEEIYHGPYLEQAPDLVFLSHKGFNLKASIKAQEAFGKGIFTGKHSQEDAFLVVKGKENDHLVPQNPTVSDIVGIKNKLNLDLKT
jgi:predicted AlkP superfamily phosphohydrolase/phosphomutase